MAVAVVASEALVAFGLYAMLRIRNLDPLAIAGRPTPAEAVAVVTAAGAQT
jgi:hypothetical protein